MDKRTEKIFEDMENNSLGLDDSFDFKCRSCGKCCKNRHDIILTTRDLYSIARSLGRAPDYVVKRYCDVYVGDSSRIPIVRLKPTGSEQACPLLHQKRCIVHTGKPVICALYPLGRAASFGQTGEDAEMPEKSEPKYFFQSDACGSRDQTHTVRSWLNHFNIPIEDEFYPLWNEMTVLLSTSFRKLESQEASVEALERLRVIAFLQMYIN